MPGTDKILFFKLGALGDVLMTTPLVRAVKKKYPKSTVHYYCGRSYFEVLKGNPYIDKLIVFDQDIFFKKNIPKIKKLGDRIKKEKYDAGFALDKHWSIAVFLLKYGVKYRIGFNRGIEGLTNNFKVKYHDAMHEIRYYLELGKGLDVKSDDTDMDLIIEKESAKYTDKLFREHKIVKSKTICIVPGGANNPGVDDDPIRRWPIGKYIELINILQERYPIILLGGPKDKAICDKIVKDVNKVEQKELAKDVNSIVFQRNITNTGVVNLTGKTTINQSAAIMRVCRAVICNDSGPMHIASAVNSKVISIFGPTNPDRKAPLHKESHAIWKDEKIYEPSYELYGKKPKHENYFENVEVEDVLKYI